MYMYTSLASFINKCNNPYMANITYPLWLAVYRWPRTREPGRSYLPWWLTRWSEWTLDGFHRWPLSPVGLTELGLIYPGCTGRSLSGFLGRWMYLLKNWHSKYWEHTILIIEGLKGAPWQLLTPTWCYLTYFIFGKFSKLRVIDTDKKCQD